MTRTVLLALLAGCIAAAACLFLAVLIAGAGHGWTTPFRFSLWGFLAFPAGAYALMSPKRFRDAAVYGLLLALALASDYLLYAMTDEEGWKYFHAVAPFNFIWLAAWSLWQLAMLYAFMAALSNRSG